MQYGDDFEDKILEASESANELVVLLTPWALTQPYIWQEIGAFWVQRMRIVGISYGLTATDFSAQEKIHITLKRINLVDMNKIDSYFEHLKRRVETVRRGNG